jgi:gas vesicle protein
MKTVIIFTLVGALIGVAAASLIVPPTLSWYNETGFLSQKDQAGQVQAMVNIPQVIRYATDRLIKGQLIGAAVGAAAFLVLGSFVAAGGRKRRTAATASAGPTG